MSDENRIEIQRDIYQRLTDDLQDGGFEGINLSYHLTSIYDHSIFEAFSKVVQKLIPQLHALEQTLNMFISVSQFLFDNMQVYIFFWIYFLWNWQNSRIEKAFLFDVLSKIYIATDGSPVDIQSYELCCDMIDVVIDISGIYGYIFFIDLLNWIDSIDMDFNFFYNLLFWQKQWRQWWQHFWRQFD